MKINPLEEQLNSRETNLKEINNKMSENNANNEPIYRSRQKNKDTTNKQQQTFAYWARA